jgi:hypothetical protein
MLPIERLAHSVVRAAHEFRQWMLEPDADRRPEGILRCESCSKEVLPGEGWHNGRLRETVCGDPDCAHQLQTDKLY